MGKHKKDQALALAALLIADAVLLTAPQGSVAADIPHEVKKALRERFEQTRQSLLDVVADKE